MEYYAVISKTYHRIIANYYSDKGQDLTKPGKDYDQSTLVHIIVPTKWIGVHFLHVIPSEDQPDGYVFEVDQDALQQSIKEQWEYLREIRNKKLAECDWRMTISDRPIQEAERVAWMAYRQALRDLPSTTTDPAQVIWPTVPSS